MPDACNNKIVRLGLLQHPCPPEQGSDQALACALDMIRDAAAQGAQIVVTQELFHLPYFPQTEDVKWFELAEPIPGPTSQQLCNLAGKLNISIIASLFEKRAAGIFHNTSITIAPQGGRGVIIGTYRKMHVPDDPRFYEKFYFAPGDLGWQVHRTPHAAAGMLICWDQWFPEAARLTALRGAQLLVYPTAIAWSDGESHQQQRDQIDAWITVQRAHAISNGVFVAAANRVGSEGELHFWGSSFVADPTGRIIARADEDRRQVLIADCDLSHIDAWRQAWPLFRDRRIDAYAGLTRRYLD